MSIRSGRCASDRILMLIVLSAAVTGIVFAAKPEFDIELTRRFFDPATQRFPLAHDPLLNWLRDQAMWVVFVSAGCAVAAVVVKLLRPSRPMPMPGRAVIFMIVTLALGPGILVNGILKEHWARPRPGEVIEFGGDKAFVPWWDSRGTCDSNCSFVSGETATATWLLAPAVLVPGAWRVAAVGAALLFTAAMAALRLAFGAHFFTDVAFAFLLTALLVWIGHALCYRWPRMVSSDAAIDRGIGRLAYGVRDLVRRFLVFVGVVGRASR